jgi:hypothetical protein
MQYVIHCHKNGKYSKWKIYCENVPQPSPICAAIFLTKHIILQMRQFSCLPNMVPRGCFLFIKLQRNLKVQKIWWFWNKWTQLGGAAIGSCKQWVWGFFQHWLEWWNKRVCNDDLLSKLLTSNPCENILVFTDSVSILLDET